MTASTLYPALFNSTPNLKEPNLMQFPSQSMSTSALATPTLKEKTVSGLHPESISNTLLPQFFGQPASNAKPVNPQVFELNYLILI